MIETINRNNSNQKEEIKFSRNEDHDVFVKSIFLTRKDSFYLIKIKKLAIEIEILTSFYVNEYFIKRTGLTYDIIW